MNTRQINTSSTAVNFSNNSLNLPNIPRQFSMVFSSDATTGATNISNGSVDAGSRFSLNLSYPISVPAMAKSCELVVSQFIGWWVMLNIFENINDTFYFLINVAPYNCVIPAGIYNLSNLSSAITRAYQNITPTPTTPFPITFLSDDSTQRVVMLFGVAGVQVDFTQPRSMRQILGYYGTSSVWQKSGADPQDLVPLTPSFINQSVIANTQARFNTINSLLINCAELSGGGIPVNTGSFNTIASVPIEVPVGSQIVYTPFMPPVVNADFLIGKKISNLNFSMTNEKNQPVNTNGETFSLTVNFKYYM